MAPPSFEFVVQEGNLAPSKITQTKIRRQAMKAVAAARRHTGRYGKHNLRQHTVSYTKTDSDLSPAAVPVEDRDKRVVVHKKRSDHGRGDDDHYPNQEIACRATDETVAMAPTKLSTSWFFSGLELFMMDYSIQPADLSALTSIHLGLVASALFAVQPAKLKELLSCRQWSYFEHMYSRYGHSACLDDAIRCLIMGAQYLLAPSSRTSSGMILAQYGTALKSLQKAINDPNGWADPDTLCATHILQLFSVLYPAACNAQTWSQHLSGCMRMMQLKGPHDFKTDYEKALLTTFAASITTETLLQNQVCFLEEPGWQEAVAACKLETDLFSDRSPFAIEIANLIHRLPGACKRVGDVVCGDNPSAEDIERVRQEVRQLRKEIRLFRNRFDTQLIVELPLSTVSVSDKYKRLDTLANALMCEILSARLMGSVSVSERFLMEDEIQQHGSYISKMEETSNGNDYRTAFYMSQKGVIVLSLMDTSPLWRAPCRSDDIIEAWKFRRWCDALPRRSP
ncbi:hypothetical protein CONLIGDRAFT_631160 [Coniochaeta ligniaria NRRL 30616]|uniref:Uncharacterized protein n=1 Tax=Coniochaeta ligniaria NRRL 30616 TaxID=1408157 RepID=A0A1J7IU88_9PEZI|nr:hypothetical protein CONLIGDRAFT_631160 [Coniochaeta ligniaria NRRL 30616]